MTSADGRRGHAGEDQEARRADAGAIARGGRRDRMILLEGVEQFVEQGTRLGAVRQGMLSRRAEPGKLDPAPADRFRLQP